MTQVFRPLAFAAASALLLSASAPRAAAWMQDPSAPQDQPEPPSALGTVGELELSLEEAVRVALENDLVLRIQDLATEAALYDARGSWGAFDPLLTAAVGYHDIEYQASSGLQQASIVTEEGFDVGAGVLFPLTTGGSFGVTFDHGFSESNNDLVQSVDEATTDILGVEFRQPLLRRAGRSYATSLQHLADLEYRRQLEAQRLSRQRLLAEVENAYWDLVAAIAQYEVGQTTLDLGLQQLDQNRRRLDAGVGTQVDVLQAETNVAQNEDQLLLRETEVLSAADRLKGLLYPGTDETTWNVKLVPTTPLPEVPANLESEVAPWSSALLVAQDSRGELRQQRLRIQSAEVELTRTTNLRRPELELVLGSRSRGFDVSAQDALETSLAWDFPQNTAALAFSFPIGNRTAINDQKRARAELRAARLVYDQVESNIVGEVRAAVRLVIYAARAVTSTEKSGELAQSQLEAEQARYREGLSTNFQVLEFQRQLAEARSSHTRARAALAKALMGLQLSQGILGELPQ